MNTRAAWQEALVGGGAGLLVVAGYIVVRSWSHDDADWLSFAGALIGAVVTVAGSAFLFSWQRDAERRDETALLLELLDDVDRACIPFQVANEQALKARYHRTTRQQVDEVQLAIQRVHDFRNSIKPTTARMMRASSELAELAYHDDSLESWITTLSMYPDGADFGGVNSLAHDVMHKTAAARRLLRS